MDDFLTQPWFIALLGSILAIVMLSFGAMVFVKRKHMLMKQSALTTIRGKFIYFILVFTFILCFNNVYVIFEHTYKIYFTHFFCFVIFMSVCNSAYKLFNNVEKKS